MYPSRAVKNALVILIAMLSGCGDGSEGPPVYSVTGKVTFQGSPLKGYRVTFVSTNSASATGATAPIEDDGAYSMLSVDGRSGCAAGKYKVVIRPEREAKAIQEAMKNMNNMKPGKTQKGLPEPESKIPKTFASAETSTKEVEVKAGSNVIDIAI